MMTKKKRYTGKELETMINAMGVVRRVEVSHEDFNDYVMLTICSRDGAKLSSLGFFVVPNGDELVYIGDNLKVVTWR